MHSSRPAIFWLLAFLGFVSLSPTIGAQAVPANVAPASVAAAGSAESGPVAVPVPSEKAMRYYRTGIA